MESLRRSAFNRFGAARGLGRLTLWLSLATSCATPEPARLEAASPSAATAAAPRLSSGTALETYFPLVEGHRYSYEFETDDGRRGLLSIRHRRASTLDGSWELPNGTNAFSYADDGVLTLGEGVASYILRAPIELGAEWPGGKSSKIEVTKVDLSVTTPGGAFRGCIETSETRGGDVPLSVTSVYCPDVGMVMRALTSGGRSERLVLKGYGAPLNLGPDGVRVFKEN